MASWPGPQPTWHVPTQPMPQLIPCYVSVPPPPPTTDPAQPPNPPAFEQASTSQLLQRITVLETELRIERENKFNLQQTCNYLIKQIRLSHPQIPPQSPKRDADLIRAHRKSVVQREKIRLQRTYIRHLKHTVNRTGDLLTSGDNGCDQLLGLPTLSPASRTSSSSETTALWESGATTPVERSEEDAIARQEEQVHQGLGITAPEWKGKSTAPSTGREKQIRGFEPQKWIERRLRAATQAQTVGVASSHKIPPLSGQKALNPSAAAYVMPERSGNEAMAQPAMQYPAVRLSQVNPVLEEKLIDFTISEEAEEKHPLAKSDAAPIPHLAHEIHNPSSPTKSQGIKEIQDLLTSTQTQSSPISPPDHSHAINHTITKPAPNSPEDIELTKSILFYHPTPYDSNVYRTIIATDISPTTSAAEVMSHVCGGPVLRVQYMNTVSILGKNSALITFVYSDSARAFLAYASIANHANLSVDTVPSVDPDAKVRFAGIKYDLLATPTFPPSEEQINLIAGGRVSRCLSVRNIPTRIPLSDLRAEFSSSECQVDDGAVISVERGGDIEHGEGIKSGDGTKREGDGGSGEGIEHGGDGIENSMERGEKGVVYLHTSSLLAANRVFWRVKYCRRFGELEVRFEGDVCDRPIPSIGSGGEVEGVEEDTQESPKHFEKKEGQKECAEDGETGQDMVVQSAESSIVTLTVAVESGECPDTGDDENEQGYRKEELTPWSLEPDADENEEARANADRNAKPDTGAEASAAADRNAKPDTGAEGDAAATSTADATWTEEGTISLSYLE